MMSATYQRLLEEIEVRIYECETTADLDRIGAELAAGARGYDGATEVLSVDQATGSALFRVEVPQLEATSFRRWLGEHFAL